MRQYLFVFGFFLAAFATAQTKQPDQYTTASQKNLVSDCYVRKFDAGTSALRRSDFKSAIRYYEEAKTCPEAKGSARRQTELQARIDYCQAQMHSKRAVSSDMPNASLRKEAEKVETTGRKFHISSQLTNNTDPNCFNLTVREADRAFRDSCWDDAAKLYRAAKTCADANQTDRERMSNRIEACRSAAEDELLQKEQKAIRTARHALAANLADDAMELLQDGTRSLAWRLADFANFYIAPDDNPDCLEAMYAACYMDPFNTRPDVIKAPFCYQLVDENQQEMNVRFRQDSEGEYLVVFSGNGAIQEINLADNSTKNILNVEDLSDPVGFDLSPSGAPLVFGRDYFLLPNDQLISVTEVANYCFSEDGDVFYYEDVDNGMIRSVAMNSLINNVSQRKNNSYSRNWSPPSIIPVGPGLLAMHWYKGELWLGYNDHVEVLSRNRTDGSMETRLTWNFNQPFLNANEGSMVAMTLYPQTRDAVVRTDTASYYYSLRLPTGESRTQNIDPTAVNNGYLMGSVISHDSLLLITNIMSLQDYREKIIIHTPEGRKRPLFQFFSNEEYGNLQSAVISESGNWMASKGSRGNLVLWSLKDHFLSPPAQFESTTNDQVSADGSRLFVQLPGKMHVFDADSIKNGPKFVFNTFEDALMLPKGIANNWAVYRKSAEQIALKNLNTGKEFEFDMPFSEYRQEAFAMDWQEEQFVALSSGDGTVVVRSLADGSVMATRSFTGDVSAIRSIPGTSKLLVVSNNSQIVGNQYSIKVWDFNLPNDLPKVVRLQNYDVLEVAVALQGDKIAFSNGSDIRIFSLESLDNELVAMRSRTFSTISNIAFRPDGLAIAACYYSGDVTVWDVVSGASLLHFAHVWDGAVIPTSEMAFSENGASMRVLGTGHLSTIALDASILRNKIQTSQRQLISFSPDQIQKYNLDIAFKYPGNFDRLAESEDFPLIRSFFDYFRDQSIHSNNIDQVRMYCDRAFTLFELVGTEGPLQNTMLEMYEDYIMKLLLRNNPVEAARIVALLESRFNRPPIAVLAAANTSLVRHDLPAATRLYTDYLKSQASDYFFETYFDNINQDLARFLDYDLLDSTQISCACGILQQFSGYESICSRGGKTFPAPQYSIQAKTYRDVFVAINESGGISNLENKAQKLEQAVAVARTLEYPSPGVLVHPLESSVLALAEAYLQLVSLEQRRPKSLEYCEKTVNLLDKTGAFKTNPDTARLRLLAKAQMLWGSKLVAADKPAMAAPHLIQAFQTCDDLVILKTTANQKYDDILQEIVAPTLKQLCLARLNEGKIADARDAFKVAEDARIRDFFLAFPAYADLLEENDIGAFVNFGRLKTAEEIGEALFQIERLAELQPQHRAFLEDFGPRLSGAFLRGQTDISEDALIYWKAFMAIERYDALGKWDQAREATKLALDKSIAMIARSEINSTWRNEWFSQCLNYSFFTLCSRATDNNSLSEVVRLAEQAIEIMDREPPYNYYRGYVYSNLGHALWLRNQPGDRERAIQAYRSMLESDFYGQNAWELLLKDFRDLRTAGVKWPELKKLLEQITPADETISPETWRELGE